MVNGNPADGPFFQLNKDLQYVPEFSDLISAFGEEKAGKYMWAIWLLYHPKSQFFLLEPKQKVKLVEEGYLEETYVDWKQFDAAINVFPLHCMTLEARMYHDGVQLYNDSAADARLMTPKDKMAFLKGMEATAAVLERFRLKYIESEEKASRGGQVRAAGDLQSGYLSRKRN